MMSRRFRRRPRLLAAIAIAIALPWAGIGSADAYWSRSGAGTSTSQTGTITAPTGVTGSQTPASGTVTVNWIASTGSPTPTGYYLTRTNSSNVVSAACGTSSSSTLSTATCQDTAVPIGTYAYKVIAAYNSWTATSAASSNVVVSQASQSITFTSSAPATAVYNGSTYTVSATGGGSGNPVVFTSATSAVCTLSGSTVSFVGVGTCTISANQAGSTYYAAAPQVQQSFSIGKASQTISYTSTAPSNAVVAGATYTVSATGGASGNAVTFNVDAASAGACTLAGAVVTFAHTGTCVIDANQTGTANYAAANQVQQSIAVGKGSQAITFTSTAPSNAAAGGGTYTVTATGGPSGNAVTFTIDASSTNVCSIAGAVVTFAHVGTCSLDANQLGSSDYLAAAQAQQVITVGQGTQTVTITSTAPGAAVVGGTTYTATATGGASGNPVMFTSGTPSVCTSGGTNGATFTFIAAGSCSVQANQAGSTDYVAGSATPQSFTVGKGTQTVSFTSTAPNPGRIAGTYTPTAVSSAGLTVTTTVDSASAAVCSISGGVVTFNAGGSCTLDANQAGTTNWNAAAQVQQSVTVSGAKVTGIVLTNANGQAAQGDTLAITFAGPVQANTFCSTWSGTSGSFSNNNNGTVVTITKVGATNQLTVSGSCSFTLGTVDLGTAGYTSNSVSFSGNGSNTSKISLSSAGVLTITLGSGSSSSAVAASTVTYTPTSTIPNAVDTTPFAATGQRF